MNTKKKRWQDMTSKQRVAVVVLAIVQIAVNILIQRDLGRRSDAELRGGKALWRMAAFVHPVGPIAYFVIGRRRPAEG